jgi:N-acetylmuramoyl-L-alanine amidase
MFRLFVLILLLLLSLPTPMALAVKVVVDAGHGGTNPGAIGVNGLEEKHANLDIAYKLQQELVRRGYEAVLSRTDDRDMSLEERVRFTNAQKADLFVSVHANFYDNPAVRGSMVLYYDSRYPQAKYPASEAMTRLSPESMKLAQSVLDQLVAHAGTENRGLLPSAAYVIRSGQVPSILVETAFLSNAKDAAMLADDAARRKMAIGIAEGIAAYMPAKSSVLFPDTVGHWAREAIVRLQAQGIVQGIDNRFEPDRAITRAEFLTIVNRIRPFAGTSVGSSTPQTPADLDKNHWAYATLMNALATGFIEGYEDGSVKPDRPITRGEVAVLLNRLIPQERAEIVSAEFFADVPADLWSARAIYRLRQRGLIDGVTAERFMPDKPMTRAEMAVLADRFIQSQSGG